MAGLCSSAHFSHTKLGYPKGKTGKINKCKNRICASDKSHSPHSTISFTRFSYNPTIHFSDINQIITYLFKYMHINRSETIAIGYKIVKLFSLHIIHYPAARNIFCIPLCVFFLLVVHIVQGFTH